MKLEPQLTATASIEAPNYANERKPLRASDGDLLSAAYLQAVALYDSCVQCVPPSVPRVRRPTRL